MEFLTYDLVKELMLVMPFEDLSSLVRQNELALDIYKNDKGFWKTLLLRDYEIDLYNTTITKPRTLYMEIHDNNDDVQQIFENIYEEKLNTTFGKKESIDIFRILLNNKFVNLEHEEYSLRDLEPDLYNYGRLIEYIIINNKFKLFKICLENPTLYSIFVYKMPLSIYAVYGNLEMIKFLVEIPSMNSGRRKTFILYMKQVWRINLML